MQLRIKTQKHITFFLITTPLIFLFGFGMIFAKFDTGEPFLPLMLVGVLFIIFGILAIKELYTQITQTKEYIFNIDEEQIKIDILFNGNYFNSYTIFKSNLVSFEPNYWNNYGAVTTTYLFTLNDGNVITIKEDFGKKEKEIYDTLISYKYLPKFMIDVFKKKLSNDKNT